jgi:lipopolysaccharide/colanic/teichoic acid biosynthesis glycosyltransferase
LLTEKTTSILTPSEEARPQTIVYQPVPEAPAASLAKGESLKRVLDIVFCLLLMPVVIPICLVVALLIRLDSAGPVFFRHRRLGQFGTTFDMLKFRSMVDGADKMLASLLANDPVARKEFEDTYKLQKDPRCTRVGRWLRRTSLDEIPQLFNVLRGEMSIVGPRAIVEPELQKYGDAGYRLLTVKPGITGMWQVSGRSDVTYPERIQLDMAYIEQRSVRLDLSILLRTVLVVFRRTGAV